MESNEMTLIAEGHCTRFHITTPPSRSLPQPHYQPQQSLHSPAALTPVPRSGRRSTRRRFTSVSVAVATYISGHICVSDCICCSGCIWIWVVVVVRRSWLACYNSDAFILRFYASILPVRSAREQFSSRRSVGLLFQCWLANYRNFWKWN